MRGLAHEPQRHAARGAGKGGRACKYKAERPCRQIVRAVHLADLLLREQRTAGCGALAGLFRGLKEQEHAPSDRLALKHERRRAECGGVAVVSAQVRRAALRRRERVIVRAQGDGGARRVRLAVRGVEARAAFPQLQCGVRAQELLQRPLRHDLLSRHLRARVQRGAQRLDPFKINGMRHRSVLPQKPFSMVSLYCRSRGLSRWRKRLQLFQKFLLPNEKKYGILFLVKSI